MIHNKELIRSNKPLLNDTQKDVLAYAFGGLIEEFYEKPENQARFEEWKKKREKEEVGSEIKRKAKTAE